MSKIDLLHGDCLELMKDIPDGSIDMILADPPYNIARKNNFSSMGRYGIDFGSWDKDADIFSWIAEGSRVMRKGAGIIIFNDWKNLGDLSKCCEYNGLIVKDCLRWVKSNPMPRNRDRRYITDFEYALWAVKPGDKWVFNRQSNTYQRPEFGYSVVGGNEKTPHPTQKPVALMEELLLIHSFHEATVLDPFMGSGTTGIACLNTGRNFIGMELEQEYFDIAKQRIAEAQAQAHLQEVAE